MQVLLILALLGQFDPLQQSAPAPASSGVPFRAQGMRLGDRPLPAYMAANGLDAADMQKPQVFAKHKIEVGSGEVLQFLCFQYGCLEAVSLTFDPGDYDEVIAVFSRRLGKPTHKKTEALTNSFGAGFVNEIAMWQTDCGLFEIKKYGQTANRGFGFIASQAYLQRSKEQRKSGRTDAATKF